MYTKKNGKWNKSGVVWNSNIIRSSLVQPDAFLRTGESDSVAFLYTTAYNLNDVFEDYRRFYDGAYAAVDEYSFWIKAELSSKKRRSVLDNYYGVEAVSSSTVVELGPGKRGPQDYVEGLTYDGLVVGQEFAVGGVHVAAGREVLLKDQWYETLSTYTFTKSGNRRVLINTNTHVGSDDFFTLGNDAVFFDTDGIEVLRSKITNLKYPTISSVLYVQFDVLVDVPDSAVEVADLQDGSWSTTTAFDTNGVFSYDGNALARNTDLTGQLEQDGLVIWSRIGQTGAGSTYYLKRDLDALYPEYGDDFVYERASTSVVQSEFYYDIDPDLSGEYRFVVLDPTAGRSLASLVVPGTETLKDAGNAPMTIVEFVGTSSPSNTIQKLSDYYEGMDPSDRPTFEFRSTSEATFVNFDEGDSAQVTLSGSNRLLLDISGITVPGTFDSAAELNVGDFIRLKMLDGESAVVLDDVFVLESENSGVLTLYPPLPSEMIADLKAYEVYDFYAENLNTYRDLGQLVAKFDATPAGRYYRLLRNGFSKLVPYTGSLSGKFSGLNLNAGDVVTLTDAYDLSGHYVVETDTTTVGQVVLTPIVDLFPDAHTDDEYHLEVKDGVKTYDNLAVEVTTNDSMLHGCELTYPTNLVFGPSYSVIGAVQASNASAPATIDAAYEFTRIPHRNYTYKNLVTDDRFGFSGNALFFGPTINASGYDVGLKVSIEVSGGGTYVRRIVKRVEDADGSVTLYLDQVLPSGGAPSAGTTVAVNGRRTMQQISDDLEGWYGDQAVFAKALAADANVRTYLSGIMYSDGGSPSVLLNAVSGASADERVHFVPNGVDLVGVDASVSKSVSIAEEDWFEDATNQIVISASDTSSKRIRFIDGLKEELILDPLHQQNQYAWILQADVVPINAVVGCTQSAGPGTGDLIWYKGEWRAGTWQAGVWMSGTWRRGVWNGGTWNSVYVQDNGGEDVTAFLNTQNDSFSTWVNGIWNVGTWNGGTWQNGTWNDGTWQNGTWFSGVWTTGTWNSGTWQAGTWNGGVWTGGDFETGSWLDGTWDSSTLLSRFGTKATMADRAFWYGGTWNGGQFHSGLNSVSGQPSVSLDHRCSVWWNGTWTAGEWYGGTYIYGTWSSLPTSTSSIWHGGVWMGGWPVSNWSDSAGGIKELTLDVGAFDTLLSVSNTSHRISPATGVLLLGWPTSYDAFTDGTFVNRYLDNGQTSTTSGGVTYPSTAVKTVQSVTNTKLNIVLPGSSSVSYVAEDQGHFSGQPYVAAVFGGGVWKGGTWMHGIFRFGRFEGGLFRRGLVVNGQVGLQDV